MANLILVFKIIVEFTFDILQKLSRRNSNFKKKCFLKIRFLSCRNRLNTCDFKNY